MAYKISYSDYPGTDTGPPDPERWIGPVGPSGPEGEKGDKGDKGDQGLPGTPYPDAPTDGAIYGRGGSPANWTRTLPLSGGTVAGATTFSGGLTAPNGSVGMISASYNTPGNTFTGTSTAVPPRLNIGLNLAGTVQGQSYVNYLFVTSDNADARLGGNGGLFTLGMVHNASGTALNGGRGLLWSQMNITGAFANPALEMLGIAHTTFVSSNTNGAFVQPLVTSVVVNNGGSCGSTLAEMLLSVKAGGAVAAKCFLQFTYGAGDAVAGSGQDAAVQFTNANAGGAGSPGARTLIRIGNEGEGWPVNTTAGTVLGVGMQIANQSSGRNQRFIAPQCFAGIDFTGADFTQANGYAFRSAGFSVNGAGQTRIANAVLGSVAGGAALDVPNQIVTNAAVAVGGVGTGAGINDYYVGDIILDGVGGQYRVATVTTGKVATVTVLAPGTASAPPANPVAATGGSGSGCTLTLTWSSTSNGLSLNPTGQKIGFNGATPAAKPTVSGSRAANAALASLLTALAGYGLVTDSSTA